MSTWKICNCYYTNNYFLPSINAHVIYESDEQFRQAYDDVAVNSKVSIETLLAEVKHELLRRRVVISGRSDRMRTIQATYAFRHPKILQFSEDWLDPEFLSLGCLIAEGKRDALTQYLVGDPDKQLYQIPVFRETFCRLVVDELDHIQLADIPKQRPNTMNLYGVLLDEMGFREFFENFRTKYLNPLSAALFPSWTGLMLDSHRAFTVNYGTEDTKQSDLAVHYDNAEVTLNVALNAGYSGGQIYFDGIKVGPETIPDTESRCTFVEHRLGWGILHRGRQLHGALPLEDGNRSNLIIWMRSSSLRNTLCPMCWRPPTLLSVEHEEDYGDGFAVNHSVCALM